MKPLLCCNFQTFYVVLYENKSIKSKNRNIKRVTHKRENRSFDIVSVFNMMGSVRLLPASACGQNMYRRGRVMNLEKVAVINITSFGREFPKHLQELEERVGPVDKMLLPADMDGEALASRLKG